MKHLGTEMQTWLTGANIGSHFYQYHWKVKQLNVPKICSSFNIIVSPFYVSRGIKFPRFYACNTNFGHAWNIIHVSVISNFYVNTVFRIN